MNIFLSVITIYLFVLSTSVNCLKPSPRVIDGTDVGTLTRFPHHVTIFPRFGSKEEFNESKICSGSIINDRWILTALNCVNQGNEYRIDFKRFYIRGYYDHSFSVIIDKSSVVPYPTNFDDIALMHLPIILEFSDTIQPVMISGSAFGVYDKFGVMAGFGEHRSELQYGMFETYDCKNGYLQLCTKGWGNSKQAPCIGNEGGGLLIDWPQKPILIGIYSKSAAGCQKPTVFTNVGHYYKWIKSVIGDGKENIATTYEGDESTSYPY